VNNLPKIVTGITRLATFEGGTGQSTEKETSKHSKASTG